MNKLLAGGLLAALLITACSPLSGGSSPVPSSSEPTQSQSETQPQAAEPTLNKALEATGLLDNFKEDTLAAVQIVYSSPEGVSAATVEKFIYQDWGPAIYILPRYAGSEIVIEALAFDEASADFLPDGVLMEATATDDYALMLQTDLPEGGPQLRVTVRYNGKEAVYTPTYDGRGDTVYPIEKDGVVINELQPVVFN